MTRSKVGCVGAVGRGTRALCEEGSLTGGFCQVGVWAQGARASNSQEKPEIRTWV